MNDISRKSKIIYIINLFFLLWSFNLHKFIPLYKNISSLHLIEIFFIAIFVLIFLIYRLCSFKNQTAFAYPKIEHKTLNKMIKIGLFLLWIGFIGITIRWGVTAALILGILDFSGIHQEARGAVILVVAVYLNLFTYFSIKFITIGLLLFELGRLLCFQKTFIPKP